MLQSGQFTQIHATENKHLLITLNCRLHFQFSLEQRCTRLFSHCQKTSNMATYLNSLLIGCSENDDTECTFDKIYNISG